MRVYKKLIDERQKRGWIPDPPFNRNSSLYYLKILKMNMDRVIQGLISLPNCYDVSGYTGTVNWQLGTCFKKLLGDFKRLILLSLRFFLTYWSPC